MSTTAHERLVGRDSELGRIARFLDQVPGGPAGLLIEGPSGIGKTSLWTAGLAEAHRRRYRVLVSRPAEPDAALSFAVLGDLLGDITEEDLSEVPEPQRRPLDVALLRAEAEGAPPDALAVSLGARAALRALSRGSPVIVAVDDLQWVDAASAQALDFAFRRLDSDAVGLLGTFRAGEDRMAAGWATRAIPDDRIERIEIGGAGEEAFVHILRSRVEANLPRSLLIRLHRASGGNPLRGLELARALLRAETLPDPGSPLPVPLELRDLIRDRLAHLPNEARDVLAAAALTSQPTVDLLDRVGGFPGGVGPLVALGVETGTIEIREGVIRFAHPLLAAVLSSDLRPQEARRLHRRLAEAVAEPEDRARHLAFGAEGPDEEVAAEVEAEARAVRKRGAPAAAAELCEQALRLTPSDLEEEACRRTMAAAEYHLDAGDARRSRALLEELVARLPSGPSRAAALQRLGWARYHEDSWTAAARLFEEARAEAGGDPRLEASIALDGSLASLLAGDIRSASEQARRSLDQAEGLGDDALIAEAGAVAGSIDFLTGSGVPDELMDRAVAMETWRRPRPTLKQPSVALGVMLKWSDDYERGRALLTRAHRRMVESGNERSLPFILFHLAELECWAGDWTLAQEYAEQGLRIAADAGQDTGSAFCLYAQALVHALRGLVGEARAEAEEGLALAGRSGAVPAQVLLRSVLGFVEVSLGDYRRAFEELGPLAESVADAGIFEPGVLRYLGDAIETLIVTERVERAQQLIEALDARSGELDRPWGSAVAARCRGLLASTLGDQAAAVAALEGALGCHERFRNPFELARTELALGMVLRRDRRKKAARETLGRALERFESLGAPLWGDRARAELSRIGGRAPSSVDLTPTEKRVAELVAGGAKNQEVAEALFLSLKTVEWNLSNIYRKLGVRSRTELARWMAGPRR